MAKKNRNDYFKLMEEQLEYSVQASELLEEILCNFSAKEVPAQREKIHSIEHKADEIHHDILAKLSACSNIDMALSFSYTPEFTLSYNAILLSYHCIHHAVQSASVE